jgi:hypothetical protein
MFRNLFTKTIWRMPIIVLLVIALAIPAANPVQAYTGIPTFSIVTVVKDVSVTIQTNNFPANEVFTVRMGPFGTLGIGGTVVATTNSGVGGAFQATYTIPATLVGTGSIAIRMDSASGFFSYNWFYNTNGNVPPTTTPVTTGIPTITIVSVVPDISVTIQTHNFPASTDFTVRMGPFGTGAIGGTVVATTNSGTGGSFQATYNIPASLKGSYQISIRMDSPTGYYFAYNWFYNSTTSTPTTPGYTGIPSFSILSVTPGVSVTVRTNNYPANKDFTVRMGAFGTLGIGGTVVGTTNSGAGGVFEATYSIPAALAANGQIAIRMDSTDGVFFAYNWFYNTTSTTPTTTFTGIPTFTITGVVKDTSVTILTNNFPPNETFTARMGTYGTLGIGGTVVGTAPSGSGGAFSLTFNIPASLAGSQRIAIRLDSSTGRFFSYNWFWNNANYP